uniref:RRM domain-containing protein n=1 Tax=Macrostomum lignano TaxID=282301 RepID=A0A1I8H659_9PLAT
MKEETCYLWISQLPPNVTQQTLTDLFSSYGCVLATKIHEAGNLRGAVLSFPDAKVAAKACAARHLLNGHSLTSEHCDQSGEPGLQRLKDLASGKFSDKSSLENGSTSVNNNNSPPIRTQVGKQDGSKLKVLKVWNFPDRSSDGSIQNGLFHEYRKVGKVSSIQVRGEKDDRHALIVFKRAEDAESAYELTKSGKSFFGMTLNVERLESADEAGEQVFDEFHPRASRTLLVSNIEPGVQEADLREKLAAYGAILDVELKSSTDGPAKATVQFSDIRGAAAALRQSADLTVGGQRVRLSYQKSQPTNCVWLANLASTVTESLLSKTFACHGRLRDVCVNSHRHCALVFFNELDDARRAVDAMKCASLLGQRLLVDFASQPCQKHFVDELVTSGQCSDYKLFDQLLAPELHRGIISSAKAAARYRDMMLEYVKARSHGNWRKVQDCGTNEADQDANRPTNPPELREFIESRQRVNSGSVRRKSGGHSSDGDVPAAKDGSERDQRLLARLSCFEDARSECSDADTSGSTAEQSGLVSDSDRLSTPGWLKKSNSPSLSSRSPAASTRKTPRATAAASGGLRPAGQQSVTERETRCLEQAVSAYEAALGTRSGSATQPLVGLFDCQSPSAGTCTEANPTSTIGEEEVRSSSTMPTPPETPVSPTPPLRVGQSTMVVKRRRNSESEEADSDAGGSIRSGKSARRHIGAQPPIKRENDAQLELAFDPADWAQPYESMYDKIKRRQASRTASASDGIRSLTRPGEVRRSDENSRKRSRPRPPASRQQSAAGPSASDTEDEAMQENVRTYPAQEAVRSKKQHQLSGSSSRFRSRKSTTTGSEVGGGGGGGGNEKRRRGSSSAAKAPASKRLHRSSKSGKASRGKMSVDSVFGSSSDSEEAAAPSTPSTVPMTDSSRAESVVDPGSPPAGSRLTDIFAEAKAQLDPRAVTEKSLFSFSDDETFEPAPDLPTIDRFQPDAAAISPDRVDDDEPPKLAAAHADLETTAAHALAQLSQRPAAISLSQPQFRVPELSLRPLIPAPPPPPLPPVPQPQTARSAAPEAGLMLHPVGPPAQPARPPMQPAAQQDLDQFVQDVIRKVQAAPPNQAACWDNQQQQAGDTPTVTSASSAVGISVASSAEVTPTQPTISLTGGLAQRPAKKSPPAMEALALQHLDDVIREVVEGNIDLSPYMERDRLRYPSGERFTLTPVPPAVTPVRPPSVTQPALPPQPPSSLPTPVTTAPELRLQPFSICSVTTCAAPPDTSAAPIQQVSQLMTPQSIAVSSLSTTSTTSDSTGNDAFAQR